MNHLIFDKLKQINSPIADGVIYLTRHGSKAYGTSTPDSDEDFKGIGIPSKEYYYGIMKDFEQQELKDPDTVIYELRKFFRLMSNVNPNCVETLFTDPEDHIYVSKAGEKILENRKIFLSKRVRWSFAGYAISQLRRIKNHRKYITHPMTSKPVRSDFGLEEESKINKNQLDATIALVQKEMDRINFDWLESMPEAEKIGLRNSMAEMFAEAKITSDDRWLSSARKTGLSDNLILILQKEKAFLNKKREWDQFLTWKENRNPKRALDEIKFGYDGKHAYHLVRLLRMCREILTTGKVIVRRPDREELLDIRNGRWKYDDLIEYAEKEDLELNDLHKKCDFLPHSPDLKKIDELCITLLEDNLK